MDVGQCYGMERSGGEKVKRDAINGVVICLEMRKRRMKRKMKMKILRKFLKNR